MTTNKEQRWAIIPPAGPAGEAEPAAEDVTRTQRRVKQPEDAADPTASRRRARTQPEPPDLDQLARQLASSGVPLARSSNEPTSAASLSSPSREAATAPPETSPTLASPAEDLDSLPRRTLADLDPANAAEGERYRPTIVERSRTVSLPSGDGGETLPSPPLRGPTEPARDDES